MKSFFLQFVSATATLSLLGSAHVALSSPSSRSCGAPKEDDSYFSVVGVQGTGVHPRQDLRDLEKDAETWNIFIQALARFQAMNQNDKLSYYKIAGMVVSRLYARLSDTNQAYTEFHSDLGTVCPPKRVRT
jgi:tyrosinase